MRQQQFSCTLDPRVIDELDRKAEALSLTSPVPVTRTALIRQAIDIYLGTTPGTGRARPARSQSAAP